MKTKLREIYLSIQDHVEHFIDLITMSVFLLFLLVGIYAVFDIQQVQASGDLGEDVVELAPNKNDNDKIDLDALRKINPEIVGWVRIDNTNIDYPITQAKDNTKYLTRGYDGQYAALGGVFLDYRNNGFKDDFSIIYAHRVDGEKMFGQILKFEDKTFFDTHKTGVLYTEDRTYYLEIKDFAVLNVDTTNVYAHDNNRNGRNESVVSEINGSALQSRSTEISTNDQILVLSTCNKDSKHYRDVLLAKMIPRG